MSSHTKEPWNYYNDTNDGKTNRIEIVAIGKTIARIYKSVEEEDLPNAVRIVECVNACVDVDSAELGKVSYSDLKQQRDELLAALRLCVIALEYATKEQLDGTLDNAFDAASAAIQKEEAQS